MSTSSVSSSTSSTSTSSTSTGLNSLGGTLQITGLASGLNTDQIITELMSIKQMPVTALQSQESGITAKDKELTTLQASLNQLTTDAQALEDPSLFGTTQAVSSSDSTRVTATSTSGAGVGGYQVAVTQLANSAQRTFAYTSPTSADTITIDGHPTTIGAGESISNFVASINSDSGATVYAAATDSGTVVFSDRATGDTGTGAIAVSDSGGALAEKPNTFKEGQNAEYSVDGVSGSASSNAVTGAIPGVTLNLAGVTTTSGPVTVNVSPPAPDQTTIQTAMQTFITDYNAAITAVQTQMNTVPSSTDPTVGTLYQDPQLGEMLSSMRSLMYQGGTDGSGAALPTGMASMLDIGVSTGAASGNSAPSASAIAGNLTLNATKLAAALSANPTGVQSVLISWADSFAGSVDSVAGLGGTLASRITSGGTQISNLATQITDMQSSLNQYQTGLVNQFAQLESTLSSNSSEATWLSSQIAALPA